MHIEIGYTYAIVDVFNKGEKIGEIYYGVCNKTKKVAHIFCDKLSAMIVNSTYIDDNGCFDRDSCLNTDCEYCSSDDWMTQFQKSVLKYDDSVKDLDENQYFTQQKKNIEWVNQGIGKSIDELEDISHIASVPFGKIGE